MYDLAVIGSGPAGYTAALLGAKAGLKTVLFEKNLSNAGGTCLNEGCIPLKGLLYYSKSTDDYSGIISTVKSKTDAIRAGFLSRLKSAGIDIVEGEASFVSAGVLEAGGGKTEAKNIIIAAGSKPSRIFPGENVYDSKKVFELEKKPENVLIIGGGVIGCEYASFFNNIGVPVTVVEITESLLPGMDDEAVRVLVREFKKKKINIMTGSRIEEISPENEAGITTPAGEKKERFDVIFETTGRRAGVSALALEKAGIETDEKGFIKTDNNMMTTAPCIYAAGDCINTPMLAYTAYAEAENAVEHILHGKTEKTDYSKIPYLVFSSPQAGTIGLSEKEARDKGMDIRVYKHFFKASGKAVVEGNDAGFIKIIEHSGIIAGAAAAGGEIAELMNELSVIITAGLTPKQVRRSLHIHPSYSEIITEALVYGGT